MNDGISDNAKSTLEIVTYEMCSPVKTARHCQYLHLRNIHEKEEME